MPTRNKDQPLISLLKDLKENIRMTQASEIIARLLNYQSQIGKWNGDSQRASLLIVSTGRRLSPDLFDGSLAPIPQPAFIAMFCLFAVVQLETNRANLSADWNPHFHEAVTATSGNIVQLIHQPGFCKPLNRTDQFILSYCSELIEGIINEDHTAEKRGDIMLAMFLTQPKTDWFTIPVAASFATAAMLVGALGDWPYGYYTLLRFVSFAWFTWAAICAFRKEEPAIGFGVGCIIWALIFNPFFPVHLPRGDWAIIDILAAAYVGTLGWRLKQPNQTKAIHTKAVNTTAQTVTNTVKKATSTTRATPTASISTIMLMGTGACLILAISFFFMIFSNRDRVSVPTNTTNYVPNSHPAVLQAEKEAPLLPQVKDALVYKNAYVSAGGAHLYATKESQTPFYTLPEGTLISVVDREEDRVETIIQNNAGNKSTAFLDKNSISYTPPIALTEIANKASHPSGSLPLSHISYSASILDISGKDTADAHMSGIVTQADAMEYCSRDPGGLTNGTSTSISACASSLIKEENSRIYEASADCNGGLIDTTHLGTFEIDSRGGVEMWANIETKEALFGSASGVDTVSAQYKILCPATYASKLHDGAETNKTSFNCALASSWDEQTICSDPELAALDKEMGAVYEDVLSNHSYPPLLREGQRNWITLRKACLDKQCLINLYKGRIDQILGAKRAVDF